LSEKTRGICSKNRKPRGVRTGNNGGAVTLCAAACAGGGPSVLLHSACESPDMSNDEGPTRPSLSDVTLFWTALLGLYKPLSTRLSLSPLSPLFSLVLMNELLISELSWLVVV
jgi:hypothetical protein